MKYTAICFDLDGVIIDSEPLHRSAFRETLSQYGHALSDHDYEKYFAGKTDKEGFRSYLSAIKSQIPLNDLLVSKNDSYEALAPHQLIPYPGIPELVRTLQTVTPLALVTGSSLGEAKLALDTCGISQCFSAVITADDIHASKPSPEGYLLAASKLDSAHTDCIAVEDSPSGVTAAKSAGMYCIAVTTTHSSEQLQQADAIVNRLSFDTFTQLINGS